MYESYWGLSSPPFQIVSDPDIYFPSSVHEEARGRIFYAISYGKGAAMFTGEAGIGKTTITNVVVKRLADKNIDVAIIDNPVLSITDFFREIIYQLKTKSSSTSKIDIIHEMRDKLLANHQSGRKTVLIIDEAHLITDLNMLEEIRLLLNFQLGGKFLLTVILVGQPELRKTIRSMPSLDQRLTIRFHLTRLPFEDITKYIVCRLKYAGAKESLFTKDAIQLIYRYTEGVPRRINQVCDLSLLVACYEKKYCVDVEAVKKVMADEARHAK